MPLWNTQKFNKEISGLRALGRSLSLPSRDAETLRQNLMLRLRVVPQEESAQPAAFERRMKIAKFAASFMAGISLFAGTAFASESALPGEPLFTVKKAKEKIELSLTVSEQARAEVSARHAVNRLSELDRIREKKAAVPKVPVSTSTPAANAVETEAVEKEAEHEAKGQVESALSAIEAAKAKLEARGNTKAVSALEKVKERLEARALRENIKPNASSSLETKLFPKKEDKESKEGKNGRVQGASSTPSSAPKSKKDSKPQDDPVRQDGGNDNRGREQDDN